VIRAVVSQTLENHFSPSPVRGFAFAQADAEQDLFACQANQPFRYISGGLARLAKYDADFFDGSISINSFFSEAIKRLSLAG